ncbi:hypothetical protein BDK51DRAFT_40763, partial [Blyttiomyces helicus]
APRTSLAKTTPPASTASHATATSAGPACSPGAAATRSPTAATAPAPRSTSGSASFRRLVTRSSTVAPFPTPGCASTVGLWSIMSMGASIISVWTWAAHAKVEKVGGSAVAQNGEDVFSDHVVFKRRRTTIRRENPELSIDVTKKNAGAYKLVSKASALLATLHSGTLALSSSEGFLNSYILDFKGQTVLVKNVREASVREFARKIEDGRWDSG